MLGSAGEKVKTRRNAVAAIRQALIVLKHGVHGASVEYIAAPALAGDVAAEHQEEIRVVLQRVVNVLPLRAEGRPGFPVFMIQWLVTMARRLG